MWTIAIRLSTKVQNVFMFRGSWIQETIADVTERASTAAGVGSLITRTDFTHLKKRSAALEKNRVHLQACNLHLAVG